MYNRFPYNWSCTLKEFEGEVLRILLRLEIGIDEVIGADMRQRREISAPLLSKSGRVWTRGALATEATCGEANACIGSFATSYLVGSGWT